MDNILLECDLADIRNAIESLIIPEEYDLDCDDENCPIVKQNNDITVDTLTSERQSLIDASLRIHEIVEMAYVRMRRVRLNCETELEQLSQTRENG